MSIKDEYLLKTSSKSEIFLDNNEMASVNKLMSEKYDTWDWNFGRSPRFDRSVKTVTAGGILKTGVSVSDGVITAVSFRGDFMSRRDVTEIENALTGCRYESEELRKVLEAFPLPEYFGSITLDEVLESLAG